jgi:hypothetical protein
MQHVENREVSYEAYRRLIAQVDDLVAAFEEHPDESVREQAIALLTGLDMLHHEGLGRLVAALRLTGGGEALDRVVEQDPIVRTLLALYGLAKLDLPDEPEPAGASGFVPLDHLTINGEPVARRQGKAE